MNGHIEKGENTQQEHTDTATDLLCSAWLSGRRMKQSRADGIGLESEQNDSMEIVAGRSTVAKKDDIHVNNSISFRLAADKMLT